MNPRLLRTGLEAHVDFSLQNTMVAIWMTMTIKKTIAVLFMIFSETLKVYHII